MWLVGLTCGGMFYGIKLQRTMKLVYSGSGRHPYQQYTQKLMKLCNFRKKLSFFLTFFVDLVIFFVILIFFFLVFGALYPAIDAQHNAWKWIALQFVYRTLEALYTGGYT